MNKNKSFFLDTTIVYYMLHAHDIVKQAVREAVQGGSMYVSNFVRGEYIRGYLIGLIELHSTIKEEKSVYNGIQVFKADMGRNPRKVQNALESTCGWLGLFEESADTNKTLRRLGEYIRSCLFRFDQNFVNRSRDPLNCELGVMSFPLDTYDENQMLDFYREFEQIIDRPNCSQCEFRLFQLKRLTDSGIDLYSKTQQQVYAAYEGYTKQAKNMDMAARSRKTISSCWYCERLGDTIIVLSAPDDTAILTGDKQSFPALTSILGKQVVLIPSLRELIKHRAQAPQ